MERAQGWKFEDDGIGGTMLVAPEGLLAPGDSMAQPMLEKAFSPAPKGPRKRKKASRALDGADESDGTDDVEALEAVDEKLGTSGSGRLSVDYLEK